jgi:signal transduction histidine kinase
MAYRASAGEMISGYDWATTPLGPRQDWPASLRTAVDICVSVRFPVAICWGPELRLLYNDAYVPLLGAKHPAALGRPAAWVWAEIWPTIGPMLTSVLHTGETTFAEDQRLILQRAGYPEETYFTFSYSPIAGGGPDIGGVFCVLAERTTRVLAERRRITLQRLGSLPVAAAATADEACQAALRVIGENPGDAPFTLGYLRAPDSGTITLAGSAGFASQQAVAAFTAAPGLHEAVREALADQSPRDVTDPALLAVAAIANRPGLVDGTSPGQALILPFGVAGAGPPAGVLCCGVSPYRALDDDYRAFFELAARQLGTLVADVRSWEAERIRAAKLAELDQAKTVFVSNISHEFRTPLSLIMAPVEELRMAPGTLSAAAQENLEVIHRNAVRLSQLVNTLLDFSRIEAGRMEARYEPVDLARATADPAAVFRAAIEKAGLSFEVDCPALGEPVCVDRDMWEKVVLNLLSNALKYTFAGFIRVTLRRDPGDPGWAVLRVTDSGTGIPAPDMPYVFERFHRVHQARSRSNEGSGIGLALVRELVGLHGGSIAADSVLGVGSTFTVRLPLGWAHLPAGRLAQVRANPGWGRPGRALIGTLRDVTDEQNAAAREAAVSRLAAGLAGAADIGEVLTAGLAEVRQAFGARRALAAIWPPHGPASVVGIPETGGWPTLDPAARGGLEAARCQQIPHLAVEASGGGQPASVAARLAAGGGDAAIWVDRGARGPLTPDDRVLFGVLSAHLGSALARAIRYEQARDLAAALQHSVLGPAALPAGFGVRYRPAMRPLEVGGDWYDVISLGPDRIGVVVGDCVGRGLDAAVIMGQLRSACRALLLRDAAPAQVLADLDRFAEQVSGATCSTAFCASIDVAAATIRYSSAGHPPGILAHPGRAAPELLDQATTIPLAVTPGAARTEATALLRPGAALLLYTDGLIERRAERLDVGIQAAAELLQRHLDDTPDELAGRLMAALIPGGGFDDDSLVLTYRQAPARLRLNLPAELASLAGMRQSLRRWLSGPGA